ncbi:larval cuticle protein 16/17-like [Melitaea cinxia]|uniref:larval cuticle protein 16/17-like n=1 Tax=Melitaea cinxia TaxID=113334 RepID=UPI001E270EF0|nr:larval cuticle protein 16/17-like [Melitaea cinxia]
MDFTLKILVIVPFLLTNELIAAPRKPRLSLAAQNPGYYFSNIDGIPGTYSFGYDVFDPDTGNNQFRSEERYPNGTVVGSYGYVDPRGRSQRFDYIADENGYRVLHDAPVKEKYVQTTTEGKNTLTEPSITWSRPRKNNKKKTNTINTPLNILEPPRFTVLE